MKLAVINAIGFPLKGKGMSDNSKRSRILEKTTKTKKKPIEELKPYTTDSKKLKFKFKHNRGIANTEQLLVINGKYMPNNLYNIGLNVLMTISII